MLIALGMETGHSLLADTWALDLATSTWECLQGTDAVCSRLPPVPPKGPSPRGFGAYYQLDQYLFVFGGFSFSCGEGGQLAHVCNNELWALNIPNVQWSRVQTPAAIGDAQSSTTPFAPRPRMLSAMVGPGRQAGMKNPLLLIGGADLDCMDKGCKYPTANNEIWLVDVAHSENAQTDGNSDFMAEFDGNDIITIQLPTWCSLVSSMNVLWIDVWMFHSSYAAQGGKPIMLIDSYAEGSPILRWYLDSTAASDGPQGSMYVVLVLVSSLAESVTVKRWGPLTLLEIWHHFAFTLRFARVSSQGSCSSPSAVLTQAYMFLDSEPVAADDRFLNLDIESMLLLNAGVESFSIGGVNPSIASDVSEFLNFVGAMDNLRIWWPPCPTDNDPSRCSPFAFLFPILQDGTRQPSSGMEDGKVPLEAIATPLFASIFKNQVEETTGLLVYLDFNDQSKSGVMKDKSVWDGPPTCSNSKLYSDVCPGCPAYCTFAFASQFDINCLGSGLFVILEDSTTRDFYSNEGTCKCRDIDTCPTQVQNCICPKGLQRACSSCQKSSHSQPGNDAGICSSGKTATICWSDNDCGINLPGACIELDPQFCPEDLCSEWKCVCQRNGTARVLGQTASVVSGSATCSCGEGQILQSMPVVGPFGTRYPCCTTEITQRQICSEWRKVQEGPSAVWTCVSPSHPFQMNAMQPCGIDACCIPESGDGPSPFIPQPPPIDPGTPGGTPSLGQTCTLTGLSEGTWVGTFVSALGENDPGVRSFGGRPIEEKKRHLLRDYEFYGHFVPDNGHEMVMSESFGGQEQKQGQSPLAAFADDAADQQLDKLRTRIRLDKSRVDHKLAKAVTSIVHNDSNLVATMHFTRSSRTLSQISQSAGTGSPVLIVLQLVVQNKDCQANQLLCTELDAIVTAIQDTAQTVDVILQSKHIIIAFECSCKTSESSFFGTSTGTSTASTTTGTSTGGGSSGGSTSGTTTTTTSTGGSGSSTTGTTSGTSTSETSTGSTTTTGTSGGDESSGGSTSGTTTTTSTSGSGSESSTTGTTSRTSTSDTTTTGTSGGGGRSAGSTGSTTTTTTSTSVSGSSTTGTTSGTGASETSTGSTTATGNIGGDESSGGSTGGTTTTTTSTSGSGSSTTGTTSGTGTSEISTKSTTGSKNGSNADTLDSKSSTSSSSFASSTLAYTTSEAIFVNPYTTTALPAHPSVVTTSTTSATTTAAKLAIMTTSTISVTSSAHILATTTKVSLTSQSFNGSGPQRRLLQAPSLTMLTLDITLVIPYAGTATKTIENANSMSGVLQTGIDIPGLSADIGSISPLAYCGDGIRQTSDWKIEIDDSGTFYNEECDDGDQNSLYNRCTSNCKCNQPGFKLDSQNTTCVCQQNPRVSAIFTQSTLVREALNSIKMKLQFQDTYEYDYRYPLMYSSGPVIVTISGLKGSLTPDGILDVVCDLPNSAVFACGLSPDFNSSIFRGNKAIWSQGSGELMFTVLHPFGPQTSSSSFDLTFSLKNNLYAKDAIVPLISTCNGVIAKAQGHILHSSAVQLVGPTNATSKITILKIDSRKSLSPVLNITVAQISESMHLIFEALQASLVNVDLIKRLPAGARFAGLLSTAGLNYTIGADSACSVACLEFPDLFISIPLEKDVLRTQGGCVDSPDGHIQICLPGYVGLYMFDEEQKIWMGLTAADETSMNLDKIESLARIPAVYAAIATPQCNDVKGSGRAGGDKVCLPPFYNRNRAVSRLGGLAISRMPTLTKSTRPAMKSLADYQSYLNTSIQRPLYYSRSGWIRLCPGSTVTSIQSGDCPSDSAAEMAWIPARFGHCVSAVSSGRVVIFGGLACKSVDPITSGCIELKLLSDVWELDIAVVRNGGNGLTQILLNPEPPGVIAPSSIVLPDNSQRILIFSGASESQPYFALILQDPPTLPDTEVFEVRDILLRIGTSKNGVVETVGAISSHTVVIAGSKAVIFGGYVRNSPTSSTFTYALDAVTPALGLEPLYAASSGPASRCYAGLARKSELLLILYGGVGNALVHAKDQECRNSGIRSGLWDVWALDLRSQTWTVVLKEGSSLYPVTTAFNAQSNFFDDGGTLVLVLHGGIQCGYLEGVTFSKTCPSMHYESTSICRNMVSSSVQIIALWSQTVDGVAQLSYSTFKYRKLTSSSATPSPRCMHSMVMGPFMTSAYIGIIYGGLSDTGVALSDLWVSRNDKLEYGHCVTLRFYLNESALLGDTEDLLDVFEQGSDGCSKDDRGGIAIGCDPTHATVWEKVDEDSFLLHLSTLLGQFLRCIYPFYLSPGKFKAVAFSRNSSWSGADLDVAVPPSILSSYASDIRFDITKFEPVSSANGCETACVSGFCVEPSGLSLTVPTKCYTGNEDCKSNYSCSIPGGRHGHSMLLFSLGGRRIILLFGGETTDLHSRKSKLSSELFSAIAEAGSVSWVNLLLGFIGADGAERACAFSIENSLDLCPVPRRDAAITLMDNGGGQNGRMLLFGGMTYCQPSAAVGRTCSASISPVLGYLKGSISDSPTALDDLWSLSLSRVNIRCVQDGVCPASNRLLWSRIPVAPGEGPKRRWGAGISINPYTNELFLTGGATVNDGGSYSVLSELFSYKLTDAYFKNCVASGDGLENAKAGQQASFTVSCLDVFLQPAATASIFVSITGPVALSPTVTPIDDVAGSYRCVYTTGNASTYQITINVGRGGSSRRQLIPSGKYVLKVLPDSTSPSASVASGDFLSLSTAGSVGSFTILAKDSLGNRRPGRDVVDVLIYWNQVQDSSMSPAPGQVQYRITMAGNYTLSISFSGMLGANTPMNLIVQSAATDETRSYAYGAVLSSAAGVTSSIYVQTRDGYGNNALVDPSKHALGVEEIFFELCKSVNNDPKRACSGGVQELGLSVTLSYGVAPSGSSESDVAYGLYTLSYFPFSDGIFMPLVRHNSTVVVCLFDTSMLAVAQDPGAAEADACILQKQIEAVSISSGSTVTRYLRVLPSHHPRSEKRSAVVASGYMVVNATFKDPDLQTAKNWSVLVPIIAALMGFVLDLCFGCIIPAVKDRSARKKDIDVNLSLEEDLVRETKGELAPTGANSFVFTSEIGLERPLSYTPAQGDESQPPIGRMSSNVQSVPANDPVWKLQPGQGPWVCAGSVG